MKRNTNHRVQQNLNLESECLCSVPFDDKDHSSPSNRCSRNSNAFPLWGVIRIGCRKVAPRRHPPYHCVWPTSLFQTAGQLIYMNNQLFRPLHLTSTLSPGCLFNLKKYSGFLSLYVCPFFSLLLEYIIYMYIRACRCTCIYICISISCMCTIV